MDIDEAALRWQIKPRAVRKAIKENRVRYSFIGGKIDIPDDEVAPIHKRNVQAFLWLVIRVKNDPSWEPDFSTVEGLQKSKALAAFKQLAYRQYIDGIENATTVEECFIQGRVTESGMALVQQKKLPGSVISRELMTEAASVLAPFAIRLISKYVSGG